MEKKTAMKLQTKLSTLWIVVLFNMIFADIVGFMNPGALEDIISADVGVKITQELLLLFSILLELPIAMVFLCRWLNDKANRLANISVSAVTIVFVVAGADTYLSYIFFATMEIICMLLIIWYAWRWPNNGASVQRSV